MQVILPTCPDAFMRSVFTSAFVNELYKSKVIAFDYDADLLSKRPSFSLM